MDLSIDIIDTIDEIDGNLQDLKYLIQEIGENFFEKYDRHSDEKSIAWEYNRYRSLFRLLSGRLYDVFANVHQLNNTCSEETV